ncbi:hypothetical protein MM239_16645 [Belliella sp. DSM 111904]|uniref:Uncharacterized protein n=1 Tax=Belliella filtrata TaxID=2923435 RepID=A0ABS9V4X7_9BACT|nr:hypothetical protein [Belliella filtrata]MCH7411038.1 hypothetical protein [Belliella filtrata]
MLKGIIEYDEAYIEKAVDEKIKNQLKRGIGSYIQAIVAFAAESTPIEGKNTG